MFPTAVLPCNNLVPSSAIASIKTMLETDVRWPKHFVNLESRRRHEQTNQTGMLNASKHCMQESIETIHVYVICIYFIIYMYISWYIYIHIFHYIYENKSIYTYIITIIAIVDHIFLQMFRMFQLKTTKTLQRYNMMYTNTIYIHKSCVVRLSNAHQLRFHFKPLSETDSTLHLQRLSGFPSWTFQITWSIHHGTR